MKIDQLKYFKKVVETENITAAAKQLYITQPALSKSMKQLEAELGLKLFVTSGRNIELTEEAKQLYPFIDHALETIDEGLSHIKSSQILSEPPIRLHFEIGSLLIPEIMRMFQINHPKLKVCITQHEQDTPFKNSYLISSETRPGFDDFFLLNEDIFIAIPKKNPLSKKETIVLSDIENSSLIGLSESNALRQTIDKELKNHIQSLTYSYITDNSHTLRELLNQNIGISFFPTTLWQLFNAKETVIRPIADLRLSRNIYLLIPKKDDHPSKVAIQNELQAFFKTLSLQKKHFRNNS